MELLKEFCIGLGAVIIYYTITASICVAMRKFLKMPNEVFRKLLHFVLLGSLMIWTVKFDRWWLSALSILLFAAIVYPVLSVLDKKSGFSSFMTERKNGEMKQSMLQVFGMFAFVIAICWGIFDERLIAICAIYAWGFGDAFAAVIGKHFGKHKLSGTHIEGTKSVEGSLSMFVVSFISVILVLLYRGGMAWYGYIITAGITALVTTLVELYSLKGRDTVTCPIAAMTILIPLIHLFGSAF